MTAADNVLTEQFVVSVFESQPKQSAVNAKLREWKVAEAIPSTSQMMKSPDVDMKG